MAVGSLIPQPLSSLMAVDDSQVQSPDTIAGATIVVPGLPFDDAILDTIRDAQGLEEGDAESVNVGFDLVPALFSRQTDAVIGTYFNIEGIHIEVETGVPPVIVKMEELGVPHYDELIVVANSVRIEVRHDHRFDSDQQHRDSLHRHRAIAREYRIFVVGPTTPRSVPCSCIVACRASTRSIDVILGPACRDGYPAARSWSTCCKGQKWPPTRNYVCAPGEPN